MRCSPLYCKFGNIREDFIFVKIISSRNGEITLSFNIGEGKSCHSRDFYIANMSFKTLIAKIKFSRKFPNLQVVIT